MSEAFFQILIARHQLIKGNSLTLRYAEQTGVTLVTSHYRDLTVTVRRWGASFRLLLFGLFCDSPSDGVRSETTVRLHERN
jgi:hypothetical protein